jgi:HAD superfamily hydrolase (TIGR01509 family)
MNIIIPIGGIGKRFKEGGYNVPKPLIEVFYKSILEHVIDSLELQKEDTLFVIYHYSLDEYDFNNKLSKKYPDMKLINMSTRTDGAAETVLYGIEYIIQNKLSTYKKTVLLDCDTIYNIDILSIIRNMNSNGTIYFEDRESKPIYSYININQNQNNIIDIREKEKISNYANTGAYFFNDITELYEGCKYIIKNNIRFKNEFYISCVIKRMMDCNNEFNGVKIDKKNYQSLGTPTDVDNFKTNQLSFLFDLDGTLVKTDNIYYKVWKEILLQYNIELTEYIFEKCIQGNNDVYAMERLQIDTNIYKVEDISKKKDELFEKYINEIIIMDGAVDFIKKLKSLGYYVCIVTNCNRKTCISILEYMGLNKYINFIIIGNECNKPKPYPDPYLKAIELLKIIPNQCIIFEDSKSGLLSAINTFPRNVIGVDNNTNRPILNELGIKTIIENYNKLTIEDIINNKKDIIEELKQMIRSSLCNKYEIKGIELDNHKLKGGYISDVIKVNIELESGEILDCVLKYENEYTSSLTKMAYKLGLFDREYYFYECIRDYINIHVPKYIGTIRDSNFISKGIILENINKDDFKLNLDLNRESIDVSLKVIEQCAKFHSLYWNKDLTKSFRDLKKHNNALFQPSWGNFLREKWELFSEKWRHMIKANTLSKMEYIVNHFEDIQNYLSHTNLTLCHGDVKSGNLFYKKINNGYTPYFIDWQYIANGKGVQDIVFFMIESFTKDNIIKFMNLFKNYYYIKLNEYGVINYSKEEYNKDFKYATYYFPVFVAIWFGTTPTDELIDSSFPFMFIQKITNFIESIDNI